METATQPAQRNETILNITGTHTVESYPYGRLRCKAFFSVEFQPKKGFRTVFQTINPKNGRLNAPKKSTYGQFIYQVINHVAADHIESRWRGFDYLEKFQKTINFIGENGDKIGLTDEMIKFLVDKAVITLIGNMAWQTKEGRERLKPVVNPVIIALNKATKAEDFKTIFFDYDQYKELKQDVEVTYTITPSEPVRIV